MTCASAPSCTEGARRERDQREEEEEEEEEAAREKERREGISLPRTHCKRFVCGH